MEIRCPIMDCKSTKKEVIIEEDSKHYICKCSKCNTLFTIPKEKDGGTR